MLEKYKSLKVSHTDFLLFILRNIILYALLFHAYLHFQEDLDLLFLSISFFFAVLIAVFMEKIRLRFLPAVIIAVIISIIVRILTFFIFNTLSPLDQGLEKDFFFLYFDNEFIPALIPSFIVWLFNFLAFRKPGFIPYEVGCNAVFLIGIFFTQANYNISLYHPTFFGIFLGLYVLVEVIILFLVFKKKIKGIRKGTGIKQKKNSRENARKILSFLWIIIPLILLFILYLFLMEAYNKEATKSMGGLMESTLFRFDFSKYIKLRNEITVSDDLVMIMRKDGPASHLLLRRFVLSEYQPGGGFFQSKKKGIDDIPVIIPDNTMSLPDPDYKQREQVVQEYFFVNLDPTSLIAMNYPVKIIPLKNWEDSSFLRIYKVESRVSQIEYYEDELMEEKEPDLDPDLYNFYTFYGDDKPIKDMAEDMTKYSLSYLEKVLDIRDYLQENYLYSLKPGIAKDGNQLHHFLFESKKGYCSYFAFAMALMCRSIGIPARVAVGFVAYKDSEVLNFYQIKAFQAHAWVEVYFEDFGWIEFDPTSSDIAPGEDIRYLFSFEMDDKLKKLLSEILENQNKLVEEEAETVEIIERAKDISFIVLRISSWLVKYWFIIIPALYLIFIIIIKRFYLIIYFLSGNPRKKIKSLFLYSIGKLYGLGIVRKPEESLIEYADRIEHTYKYIPMSPPTGTEEGTHMNRKLSSKKGIHFKHNPYHIYYFRSLVDFYLKAVFSNEFTTHDYVAAEQAYENFRYVLIQNIPLFMRIAGFFNPINSIKRKI